MNELMVSENLTDYYDYVNSAPFLSFNEEQELAILVFDHNDLFAAEKLIIPHLRLVVSIAKQYKNYGLPIHDLIQEGNIGLMQAVHKFNPNKDARLSTFADMYIKGNIYEYILNNWKPVKIATTKALRKAFFNLRKLRTDTVRPVAEAERKRIAEKLNVSVNDIHTMEERMNTTFTSEIYSSYTDSYISYEELLPCSEPTPDEIIMNKEYEEFIELNVMGVINDLSDRNKDIILSRKFSDKAVTLSDLSEKYNISIERIRQLESNVIKKLEEVVKEY